MTVNVGDRIPSATLMHKNGDSIEPLATDEFFKGKKVVVFGLPGAFTPTCSAKHLPGFVEQAAALRAKGVDAIACVSVNDAFVMEAWGKSQNVGDAVLMLADGSAEFTDKLGLDLDLGARGMGKRSQRYAMVVDDGVVKAISVEPNPGALEVSSAEEVLKGL
jgi:peroxiredoxin